MKDVKEANERSANTADKEKRSYSCFLAVNPATYPSSQKGSCERNPESGCLLRILQQIIILRARCTTREQHPGFSKAVFSNSGSPLLRSCGSMENVLSFSPPIFYTTDSHLCSRIRQKCSVVCYFLLLLPALTHIIAQLRDN